MSGAREGEGEQDKKGARGRKQRGKRRRIEKGEGGERVESWVVRGKKVGSCGKAAGREVRVDGVVASYAE